MKIESKVTGTSIKQIKNFQSSFGIISYSALEDFKLSLWSERNLLLIPKKNTSVLVTTGNNEKSLDDHYLLHLPSKTKLNLAAQSDTCEIIILFFSSYHISKTCASYQLSQKSVKASFNDTFVIPRKTWLNEIIYRYDFERTLKKVKKNSCTYFLENEILKEIHCTLHEEKNSNLKYRFGITDEMLATKSEPIKKALTFIHNNLNKKIRIDRLCKISATSKATLIRHFKKEMKLTPIMYVIRQKMSLSDVLLRNNDLTVSEVAERVGYDTPSDFIQAYKKRFNYTPGQALQLKRKTLEL